MDFSLTKNNIDKIRQHKPTQLGYEQLQGGPHRLHLKPRKLQRVQTAIKKQKGIRLHLDGDEMKGSGFLTNIYKAHVKPHVRGLLHRGLEAAAPHIQRHTSSYIGDEGGAHLSRGLTSAAHRGVDYVGDVTGAYGLPRVRVPQWAKPIVRKSLKGIATVGATYLAPELAPITAPLINRGIDEIGDRTGAFGLELPKKRKGRRPRKIGGSFLAAGY